MCVGMTGCATGCPTVLRTSSMTTRMSARLKRNRSYSSTSSYTSIRFVPENYLPPQISSLAQTFDNDDGCRVSESKRGEADIIYNYSLVLNEENTECRIAMALLQ